LAIGDLQLAIVDCRVLIDGGGCCNTSFSISNQAAAAGHSPITNHQSAMKTWSSVAGEGRVAGQFDVGAALRRHLAR
jgi:hypothetical protein